MSSVATKRFECAVERRGARRQHLADPVGREVEGRRERHLGHAGATPARDVRNEHVLSEVALGLVEEDAASRVPVVGIERSAETDSETR